MFKVLRMLRPEIEPFRKNIYLLFLLAVLLSSTTPGISGLLKEVFDGVFTLERGPFIAIFIPIVYGIRGVFRYILAVQMRYTAEAVTARLRVRLMNKLLRLNLSFHGSNENGSGGLMSRILNDINVLQQGLFFVFELFVEPIIAAVIIATMFYNDWRLTAFCLATAPLFVFVLRKTSKSLKKYGHRSQNNMEQLTGTLKESLDGIRVIQSFNLEAYQEKRFNDQTNEFLIQRKKIIQRESAASPVNEIIASMLIAGLIYFQHGSIAEAKSTSGAFIAFVTLAGLLQDPIKKLQEAFVKLQQTIVVCERVSQILDSTHEIEDHPEGKDFPKHWKTIEFRDVSFHYGADTILKNVNLTVNRGEHIALVGTSGSGKSTLVNLIPRFFDPTSGDILIDGQSTRSISLKQMRQSVALVTQDVFLFNDSIEQNIVTGNLERDEHDVLPAAQKAFAHDFVHKLPDGYKSVMGERGGRFSGGEKQRISIARAVYKDSPILILDEATSALDSVSEMEVQNGLNSLMQDRTTFVIAHRLSTVRKADKILVMKLGEIVEQGTHRELLAAEGEYYKLHQTQMAHSETI